MAGISAVIPELPLINGQSAVALTIVDRSCCSMESVTMYDTPLSIRFFRNFLSSRGPLLIISSGARATCLFVWYCNQRTIEGSVIGFKG